MTQTIVLISGIFNHIYNSSAGNFEIYVLIHGLKEEVGVLGPLLSPRTRP